MTMPRDLINWTEFFATVTCRDGARSRPLKPQVCNPSALTLWWGGRSLGGSQSTVDRYSRSR